MNTLKKLSFLTLFTCLTFNSIHAQNAPDAGPAKQDSAREGGVAVTPSHVYMTVKPGETKNTTIKVSNNSRKPYKFELKFADFEMNQSGKSAAAKRGTTPNTLSDWIVFSPSFFEVPAGQTQKITITLSIPDIPEAYKAKWGMLYINQVTERKTIDVTPGANTIAMGVIPSFGFAINIYQNPPNVAVKKVEIESFSNVTKPGDDHVTLELKAKNTGDGISFCTAYAELVNTSTGKKQRMGKKAFTALPGHDRVFKFEMPASLEKGRYTIVGVLDYGSKEEIQAAELEFTIK